MLRPANPRVSVVMATYNGERFLEEQLQSIEAQSHKPIELIASDDGSTDRTVGLLENYARTSSVPVNIVRVEKRQGYGENFLSAAMHASGDLVSFADQDDVWAPEKIARAAAAFTDPTVMLASHRVSLIDRHGQQFSAWDQGITSDAIIEPLGHAPWKVYAGFTMTFRTELLHILPPDTRGIDFVKGDAQLPHDRWVMFLANALGRTSLISETLASYRQHDRNVFGSLNGQTRTLTRSQVSAGSALYLQAARENLDLVEQLCVHAPRIHGSMFDGARTREYWRRAVDQLEGRQAVYECQSRTSALVRIGRNVRRGLYRGHDGKFLPRAIARDIQVVATG